MQFRVSVSKAFNRKIRILLSDGHGQQLHVVGAVVTISARLGHRESICTSPAMCGKEGHALSRSLDPVASAEEGLPFPYLTLSNPK